VQLDPEVLAELVVQAIDTALGPMRERLAAIDASLARLPGHEQSLGELRDRVLTVELKAALPGLIGETKASRARPVVEDIAPEDMAASVAGLLRQELADLPVVPRTQKRIVRDAQGQIERVIEEPI
jgi:hypothetical protein